MLLQRWPHSSASNHASASTDGSRTLPPQTVLVGCDRRCRGVRGVERDATARHVLLAALPRYESGPGRAITLPMAVAATVCAPLSGILVGRFGPRRPLLIAGSFTTLGGLCLVSLDNNTAIPMLLAAYLFLGIGFGFSNAPITNTAVNGLPRSQAGLAGGITSSARQFGAALGVALAGGILGGSAPVDVAQASSWDGSWLPDVGSQSC